MFIACNNGVKIGHSM